MPIIAVIGLYLILGAAALRSYNRLRSHRLDTPERIAKYRGAPWTWFLAILSPSNYSPEGQPALRRFWFCMGAFQLGLFAILIVLAVYYP